MKRRYFIYYIVLIFAIVSLFIIGFYYKQINESDIFKEIIYASVAGGLFSTFSTWLPNLIIRQGNKRQFKKDLLLYKQQLIEIKIGDVGKWLERVEIKIRDSFSYNEIGCLKQADLDLLADLEICKQEIPKNEIDEPYAVEKFKEKLDFIFHKYLLKQTGKGKKLKG